MTPADLRAFRAAHNLSQPQLAARLGVSIQSVFRWEKGSRRLPLFFNLAIDKLTADLARERTAAPPPPAAAAEETTP